ncbi:MAG: VPLPA-CTERM-specific exosortase XrtD [Pseudomonadota bacterium]
MTSMDRSPVSLEMPTPERVKWGLLALSVLALVVFFWDALGNLWARWGGQQELSHSYFIPVISAWLVWTNREAIRASVGAPSIAGAFILLAAGLVALLGQITHIYVLQHLGIVIAIAGLAAAFGGLSLLQATAAPIAFLLFAVPPPFWVITVLSWKFQQMSSVIGVAMIHAMDIPAYLSGNIIDLGDYKLAVAEACSGLRYLFPFLSIGVMAAYLFRGPLWGKLLIVVATIPITILMNSFRIAMTGALVQAYGTEHAEGALHFFEGWVVFLLCLIALFAVVWLITRVMPRRIKAIDAIGAPNLSPVRPSQSGASMPVVAGGAAALAALFVVVGANLSTDNLIIPERKEFAGVPNEFEGWRTTVRPMEASVAEVLAADDTIVVDLVSPDQELFNLYIAYFDAQRDGRSWHSPRQCIPGGGWQITQHDVLPFDGAAGKSFNRLLIENRNSRQLVYYWYDQRGRMVANEFIMKLWLMFDAVTRQRSDGAMVRLITPVIDGEPITAADARLVEMMSELETFMPAYVPD